MPQSGGFETPEHVLKAMEAYCEEMGFTMVHLCNILGNWKLADRLRRAVETGRGTGCDMRTAAMIREVVTAVRPWDIAKAREIVSRHRRPAPSVVAPDAA